MGCLNYTIQVISLRVARGDTRTKEFVKINPRMRVPVIQDGDFVLTESVAIMRYLAREKEVEDHWYPRDSRVQVHYTVHMNCMHVINTVQMYCTQYK